MHSEVSERPGYPTGLRHWRDDCERRFANDRCDFRVAEGRRSIRRGQEPFRSLVVRHLARADFKFATHARRNFRD